MAGFLTKGTTSGMVLRWGLAIGAATGVVATMSSAQQAATYSVNTRNILEQGIGITAGTMSGVGPTTQEAWRTTKAYKSPIGPKAVR